ncbi:alpha/beta hydrolase [Erythrobacter sp. CCH5-A1]|jgi:acetyl esterase/lipase|uniref:alpha/beta hydrolase n=1 Tax=Erythrobacter sp. CCH5-A1 TaxID=1768792 RepID=UPI00082E246C|nr:alpha/beta hydrolase [Erythrobacter sp. CCH5-A1]
MKHLIAATALAATLAGCAPVEPPAASFAVTDTADYNPMTVNAVPSDPPTARIAYGSASARQYGELRVPKGKGPFPVAVLYHGGCWAGMGGTANLAALASFLAKNGIATWSPSYRELGSDGGWPNTFTDWAQGLAHVNRLARDYPLDLTRITLMGHSAGVTPAVWLASGDKGDAVVAGELPRVRGVVALDGPLALGAFVGPDAAICGKPVIAPLVGGTPAEVPGRFAMLDPVTNPPLARRLLVIDGALPDPDPALLAALRAQGVAVEVIAIDQQQHFNLLVPGTKDFAAIAPALLDIAGAR